jgi:hypothetical protein
MPTGVELQAHRAPAKARHDLRRAIDLFSSLVVWNADDKKALPRQ